MKKPLRILLFCALILGVYKVSAWAFTLELHYIPSRAMAPLLVKDDQVLVDKRAYMSQAPSRGDITLFNSPPVPSLPLSARQRKNSVKRVVGVPGDTLEIVNGRLRLNGKWTTAAWAKWQGNVRYDCKIVGGKVYMRERSGAQIGNWTQNLARVSPILQKQITQAPAEAIPANQFFVLADNRDSLDSHIFGLVPRDSFLGRVVFLALPLKRYRAL